MDAGAPCHRLEWDSRFFGHRIARVTTSRFDHDLVARILAWCDSHAIECLYFLADSADAATVRLAEDHRFRLVDVRLTLGRPLADGVEAGGTATGALIRPAGPTDVPALRAIARVSHRDSRFYHDGTFTAAQCDALYETWIEKSCSGYADAVLVAELDGRPVGYVSCHRREAGVGQIGLFAVAPETRGKGLGGCLLTHALRWFAAQGLREATVVTQGRNVSAQQLYQRGGFLTRSVKLWYHRWFSAVDAGPRR
jgi:dTDP-4-amino-4,6-dideoxy-D-galactose acyltransferase